ncbi:HAD family hydrolase [Pelagovum pacificum]|uniref:HAD family hydrolase n=1 Tax=Pelagovum pacificum TaxID=2588711 RepID=A0A5C5GCF7_9RHOB|nr:HAD family hydrolase [Pelagovum pacificum]QQA42567.1 HAD family hydrolase [Pelagovum pacificum]TNY31652.1 HAD family hydrolase [Pelagovum pacificum]
MTGIDTSRVDLVIFDCDGVLIDSEIISAAVLIEQAAALGIRFDFDYVRRHFIGRSFPTVAKTIREDYDRSLPADFEQRYRAALLERFETELHTTEGIEALLPRLGVMSCVATSSSPPRVLRSLSITGLDRFFGHRVYTASQVERGKPAPDLFLFAAQSMGVAPERALVIEDSFPGIDAAQAAGMQLLLYTGGGHFSGSRLDLPPGVLSFDHWRDFPVHLLRPEQEEFSQ